MTRHRPTRSATAFTLIELLIVVAIIAILAAIAVPNFLAAQTRSKVSRVRSDLRTLATGLEAYTVDWNRPPYDGDPNTPHYGWARALSLVTTPVAYLTSLTPDVFQDKDLIQQVGIDPTYFLSPAEFRNHSYDYATAYWQNVENDPAEQLTWTAAFGNSRWKITSAGPDLAFVNDGSFYGFAALYDPTNGSISTGDIVRSQAVR